MGPVADFIHTTWRDQGLMRKKPIVLKCIPPDSVLGKIVVYTQELPGAVAVGQPFIDRIEYLLHEKKNILIQPITLRSKKVLQAIEYELDECRFVCGHERVHKENHHTYKILTLQFMAPFFVYSALKHTRAVMQHNSVGISFDWGVSRGITRSAVELLVGLIFARYIECNADIYASDDPKIVRAGLRLFEKAQQAKPKRSQIKSKQYVELLLKWIFKYTHPTLIERIAYMKKRILYLEK